MKEEQYRTYKLILLVIFVVGTLFLGSQLVTSLKQFAENGRYVQFDRQKDFHDFGGTSEGRATQLIDTRTGTIQNAELAHP